MDDCSTMFSEKCQEQTQRRKKLLLFSSSTTFWSRSEHRENWVYVDVSSSECRQNLNMKMASRSFENAAKFRYLGTTVTSQNSIDEESKSRFNSGSAYNLSVQNLLSSLQLSKNITIKIY